MVWLYYSASIIFWTGDKRGLNAHTIIMHDYDYD